MAIKYLDAKRIRGSSTSGTYASGLGSAADGTTSNATLNGNHKLGTGCIDFNGTNGYVSLGTDAGLNLLNGGTIAMWINTDDMTNLRFFGMGTNKLELLSEDVTNFVKFRVSDGTVRNAEGDIALSDSTWYHVAGTYDKDAGEIKLYVNGVLDDTTTGVGQILTVTTAAYLGRNENGQYFDGRIDDVGIWNTVLAVGNVNGNDAGTINHLYNGGTGRLANTIPTGMLAYYNCDSTTMTNGAVATDEKATLVTAAVPASTGWDNADGSGAFTLTSGTGITVSASSSQQNTWAGYDLGTSGQLTPNDNWVCDYTLTRNSSDQFDHPMLMFKSHNTTYGSSSTNGDNQILLQYWANGVNTPSNGSNNCNTRFTVGGTEYETGAQDQQGVVPAIGTTLYYRVSMTARVHTMSAWTTSEDRTAGSTDGTRVINNTGSALDSRWDQSDPLRYIMVMHKNGVNARWTISDFKFWNATTSTSGTPNVAFTFIDVPASSNFPENTLFEETDTRNTYFLKSSAWKRANPIINGFGAVTVDPFTSGTTATTNGGWTLVNTDGGVSVSEGTGQSFHIDKSQDKLFWNGKTGADNSGSQVYYDCGVLSDTWILQFKLKMNGRADNGSSSLITAIGVKSDTDAVGSADGAGGTYSPVQNYARFMIHSQSGSSQLRGGVAGACGDLWGCDGNDSTATPNITGVDGTKTWFCQIKQTDEDTVVFTAGTDAYGGTTNGATATTNLALSNFTGTAHNFRYFFVETVSLSNSQSNRHHGYISEIKLLDGATTI